VSAADLCLALALSALLSVVVAAAQYMRAEKAEAEVERLTAERDALAAQVARVEALAEEWDGDDSCDNRTCVPHRSASALRAALAGSEADTTDTRPTDQEVSDE